MTTGDLRRRRPGANASAAAGQPERLDRRRSPVQRPVPCRYRRSASPPTFVSATAAQRLPLKRSTATNRNGKRRPPNGRTERRAPQADSGVSQRRRAGRSDLDRRRQPLRRLRRRTRHPGRSAAWQHPLAIQELVICSCLAMTMLHRPAAAQLGKKPRTARAADGEPLSHQDSPIAKSRSRGRGDCRRRRVTKKERGDSSGCL